MSEVRHLWQCGTLRRGPLTIFNLLGKKVVNAFSIHYLFAVNLTFSRLLRRHAWISDSNRCAFGLTQAIQNSGKGGRVPRGNVVEWKEIHYKTQRIGKRRYYFSVLHAIISRHDKAERKWALEGHVRSRVLLFLSW